ncbi:LysR family transcriptional regulator [Rheinheimera sp. SA_1]|uniref:LysR family transcriptional regulator n=1 Tax=Rheinheimera sp. SA_1 TaxID=1827365 RepID=UPI0007FC69B3|nr:LysR family transcriptional regulator [Rheinheimera sp. SA_1]OBP13731.1 LysR family transcriptional regulator [Rheinheimera sp. SA_1]
MQNQLELLRIFCTAVELQSFKAAAVRLGISPQVVTRAVQFLEQQQGELLFHRNTRQVQATAAAELLAARSKPLLLELDLLLQKPRLNTAEGVSGKVRIAAPLAFGRQLLAPVLADLAQRYPQLQLELMFNDRRVDVIEEKIDIGVRVGFIRDNRFIVRQIGAVQLVTVATPALLQRYGTPAAPAGLSQLPYSALRDQNSGRIWPWLYQNNMEWQPVHPRFICEDSDTEFQLVQQGLVIAQVPLLLAAADLRSGKLQSVLSQFEPEPWPLYIYRPQRGPVPERIRVVFDALSTL